MSKERLVTLYPSPITHYFFPLWITGHGSRVTDYSVPWLNLGLCLGLFLLLVGHSPGRVFAEDSSNSHAEDGVEFSAKLKWKVGGKTSKAQLFVKKDRYRIEHLGGIKTDLGYAGVTIVRLDQQKVWYVISPRRLVMAVPLTTDFLLPFSIQLEGEVARTLIGDAFVGDQSARLYEVRVNHQDRRETFYEWVDSERNILLKLVSQDRDWFVEYEHVVQSGQPDYYFNPPLGYRKFETIERQAEKG